MATESMRNITPSFAAGRLFAFNRQLTTAMYAATTMTERFNMNRLGGDRFDRMFDQLRNISEYGKRNR